MDRWGGWVPEGRPDFLPFTVGPLTTGQRYSWARALRLILALRGARHPRLSGKAVGGRAAVLARWIVVAWSLLVLTSVLGPCCEGVAGLLLRTHGSQHFQPVADEGASETPPGSDEHHHCDRVLAAVTVSDSRDAGSTLLDARAPSLPSTPMPEGAFGGRCPPPSIWTVSHPAIRLYLRFRRLLE
jgi:hypothetical protein